MDSERIVDPNASLQSTLFVHGIIKPTLKRLGIVTVAQLAQLDIRELRRVRGVGETKLIVLSDLIGKAQSLRVATTKRAGTLPVSQHSAIDVPRCQAK